MTDSAASRLRIRPTDTPFSEAMLRNADPSAMPSLPSRPVDRAERGSAGGNSEWSSGVGGWSGSRDSGGASVGRDSEWSGGLGEGRAGGSRGRDPEWQRLETAAGSSSARDAGASDHGEREVGMIPRGAGVWKSEGIYEDPRNGGATLEATP
jgi:hypothetical protein